MNREEFKRWALSDDPEAVEWRASHPRSAAALGGRARHAAAVREANVERWKDPGFRARNAAAVSAAQRRRWRLWHSKRDT